VRPIRRARRCRVRTSERRAGRAGDERCNKRDLDFPQQGYSPSLRYDKANVRLAIAPQIGETGLAKISVPPNALLAAGEQSRSVDQTSPMFDRLIRIVTRSLLLLLQLGRVT
jgi:hypothetical protein